MIGETAAGHIGLSVDVGNQEDAIVGAPGPSAEPGRPGRGPGQDLLRAP